MRFCLLYNCSGILFLLFVLYESFWIKYSLRILKTWIRRNSWLLVHAQISLSCSMTQFLSIREKKVLGIEKSEWSETFCTVSWLVFLLLKSVCLLNASKSFEATQHTLYLVRIQPGNTTHIQSDLVNHEIQYLDYHYCC